MRTSTFLTLMKVRDCGLWYCNIAARVSQDPMAVSRIWNRWVQDGNTERHAGSQRFHITSSREDRHVIRKALMDRAATPRALSQELGSFARQQVSSQTHQDGRIRVWRYRGERTLAACIRHRHTDPSPGVMAWDAFGYMSRSLLVHTDATLNSAHYISAVLRLVALPFILVLRNPTFQQDNARPHVACIVRTFFDTENVQLLP
ncbi:uncharacterized protein TNCV_3986151 [Trichonephila clavipes]|nr:uncharacterized protein TNCV_3986151 [Trichonephila clavipes]